ncbi:MAG: hypothetical protein WC201_02300 [Bacilli bacterium]
MPGRKLPILGLIVMSGLLVSSITMTVAWFVGASYMQISGFDISLEDPSLTLSTDNIHFEDSLSKGSLTEVDNFKPVSSTFASSWMNTQSTSPIFYGEYNSIDNQFMNDPSDASEATFGFYSQELYLKSSQNVYVTLVKDSQLNEGEQPLFVADSAANIVQANRLSSQAEYASYSLEEITQRLDRVIYSLRLSILVLNDDEEETFPDYAYYIIDPFKEEATMLGGVLDNDLDGYYDSYDGQEVVYGEVTNTDRAIYDAALVNDSTLDGELTCFNSAHAAGIQPFNYASSIANGLVIKEENSIALEDIDSFIEGEGMNIPLKANVSKRIVISIYLEGWDHDNVNCTMFGSFLVNLKFKVSRTWIS